METSTIFPSLNPPLTDLGTAEVSLPESAECRWFARLVETHGAAVLALLRRLCRNSHDADDVFQETAVRVWRFRATQHPNNVRAWLMTVAYRAFLDHRARRQHQSRELQESSDHTTECHADPRVRPPPEMAEQNEMVERILAAVCLLPDTVREVVTLHYSGGLSLSETAEAMSISQGTVKSRLNTALQQLRSVLQ